MKPRTDSFKKRFLLTAATVLILLFSAVGYMQREVSSSANATLGRIQDSATTFHELSSLKNTLEGVESALYRYAVSLDKRQQRQITGMLVEVRMQAHDMLTDPLVESNPGLGGKIQELLVLLRTLDRQSQELLGVLMGVESRFPAAPILLNQMQPMHMAFLEELQAAVADARNGVQEGESGADATLNRLLELRYRWAQMVSSVRVFVANRMGTFGDPANSMRMNLNNYEMYATGVDELLRELASDVRAGRIGFPISTAVENMVPLKSRYGRVFKQVVNISFSENWRADLPLWRDKINPTLNGIWSVIYRIEARLESQASDEARLLVATNTRLSGTLWLFTGFVCLLLLAAYLVFEYVVRRPVLQVAKALEAEAKGGSYTPVIGANTQETRLLLTAFQQMQKQVRSRQQRLESILASAGEGIITINEHGVIETFNNAAERLFGYAQHDILGKDVSLLMPPGVRNEHQHYVDRYLSTGEKWALGNERCVDAQRSDGSIFPMSITVSDLELEGRHLFTAIVSDCSERKAVMDRLRNLAEHDFLTGLYNRQYFIDVLERVVDRTLRQGGIDCALLYIDLDNFKYVNDTLGHLAGDRVLVEVTSILSKRTRKSDILARLGGDEFAVLLFDVSEAGALDAADTYRRQLGEYVFTHKGHRVDVGCSIGVAMLGEDLVDKEDLLARADLSCQMAKRSGRNSVHLYQEVDKRRIDLLAVDMGWTRILKDALENDRFMFALQPIVETESGRVAGNEVLLRMLGREDEVIMPSGFMEAAERFGLTMEIDRWVIEHAVELLAREMPVTGNPSLSINLPVKSIGAPGMLDFIGSVFERYDVDPSQVIFEITENAAIGDLGAAAEFMESLRRLGCPLALDDFGAGYYSFAYLKDIPVDYVKIDGAFVRDIQNDPIQLAMVRSMNEIAHAMGRKTVAKSVENEGVLALLREIGVDYVQGYLTGRPQILDAGGRDAGVLPTAGGR